MRNNRQRGEGKVGCVVTILIVGLMAAAAVQAVPVLYSNNEFSSALESIAARAGIIPQATIELQLKDKARELGITEALAPGAITVTKSGDNRDGICTIRLSYTRKIDFYGVYGFTMETNTTKSIKFVDAR